MDWEELQTGYITRAGELAYNEEIYKNYVFFLVRTRGKKKIRTVDDYCRVTYLFLEKLNKPLKDVWFFDIQKYIENLSSDNRRNFIVPQIAGLISFASRYVTNMKVTSKEIIDLKKKKSQVSEKNPPKSLSPDEVMALRNTLLASKKIRYLLTFELAYAYGLTEKEIAQCNHFSFNPKDASFVLTNRKTVLLPEYLHTELRENLDNVFLQYNRQDASNFKMHFKEAGKAIGRSLKWLDIKKTREEYGLTCAYCKNRYPAESMFWGLKKYENNVTNSMQLICRFCIDRELADEK